MGLSGVEGAEVLLEGHGGLKRFKRHGGGVRPGRIGFIIQPGAVTGGEFDQARLIAAKHGAILATGRDEQGFRLVAVCGVECDDGTHALPEQAELGFDVGGKAVDLNQAAACGCEGGVGELEVHGLKVRRCCRGSHCAFAVSRIEKPDRKYLGELGIHE